MESVTSKLHRSVALSVMISLMNYQLPQAYNTSNAYMNKTLIRRILEERHAAVIVITRAFRMARFIRLAKLRKTEAFAKWFYHPENVGGKKAHRELESFVHGLNK